MAWIESHQALEKHPKILHLSTIMGWSLDETLGKMHRFWWWCLDYAPTGNLQSIDSRGLATGLHLSERDAPMFMPALIETHLVCHVQIPAYLRGEKRDKRVSQPWRVHDWIDYAGQYLKKTKFKNHPDKITELIELYNQQCPPTIGGLSGDKSRKSAKKSDISGVPTNQPDLTNLTNQPRSGVTDDTAAQLQEFWKIYPSRNGKKVEKAATHALFLKLSIQDQILAVTAARNYAEALKVQQLSAKDPKRFLRDGQGHEPWRDWIEPAHLVGGVDFNEEIRKARAREGEGSAHAIQ